MGINEDKEMKSHYEGRYISLTNNKSENDQYEENNKASIKPYMSEEIHSVLKAMGEYLLGDNKDQDNLSKEADKEVEAQEKVEQDTDLEEITLEQFRIKQEEILKGRRLTDNIMTKSGEYIGRQGEIITEYLIQVAKENGCMLKIIMHSE